MNGISKIDDLFKLSNDIKLVEPSENTTNMKPKIKMKLLNLIESD